MIDLTLARHEFTKTATISALYIGSKYQCNVLEDTVRKEKVYGKTAIPNGRYRVNFTWSGRFSRMLPLLVDVPLFDGIRFHSGSKVEDTDGCLLPGYDKFRNGDTLDVYRSREAMDNIILPLFGSGDDVFITILGGYSKDEMTKGAE